ncbi:MAG: hypothetical protein O3A10_07240 [Chloroflexi bacterium]|nr:hypothetical protein [Chloroflexota bacterium]MDA1146097.1 hypothetical protein [Chloroflexota bacterium]
MISSLLPRNPLKRHDTPEQRAAHAARFTVDTIDSASRGDAASFMMLYYAKARSVATYIAPAFPDERERDRRLRLVFLRAWRELPSLDRPEEFDLWLLRFAHDEVNPDDAPDLALATNDPVVAELFMLPRRLREIVSLRHFFGLSNDQVAVTCAVSPTEANDWHRQGLEALSLVATPRSRIRIRRAA